jgi:hypothetical protein
VAAFLDADVAVYLSEMAANFADLVATRCPTNPTARR